MRTVVLALLVATAMAALASTFLLHWHDPVWASIGFSVTVAWLCLAWIEWTERSK